jgi:hypothetical protein
MISEKNIQKLKEGWTNKSFVKFGKSLVKGGGKKERFFQRCVDRMTGHLKNPEGFCAKIKDSSYNSTYWRGKGKTPQQAGKDVKAHQNVRKENLVRVYLEMLECDCPKYGDDPDPLAQNWKGELEPAKIRVFDRCMAIECPIQRIKCLQLIRAMGIDFNNPEYANRIDREIEAITGNYEPSGEI